jgi:hypothetical protein
MLTSDFDKPLQALLGTNGSLTGTHPHIFLAPANCFSHQPPCTIRDDSECSTHEIDISLTNYLSITNRLDVAFTTFTYYFIIVHMYREKKTTVQRA